MKNNLLFRRDPALARCPSCSLPSTLHRSKGRSFKESFVKTLTFFKIYRCSQCGWRGFLSTITITKNTLRSLSYYLVFAIVAAFVVREIIKRMLP